VLLAGLVACRSRPVRGPEPARVVSVTDGDTFHALYRGGDQRVRLIGIDTPEVPWYGGRGACFGVQSALYARRRLAGRTVGLAFDSERMDKYGRLLAYVYVGPELFNLTLVRMGFATADPVPPDTRMAGVFEAAQTRAREELRGLWARCGS
jgi:micrococcal nuclease